MSKSTRMLLIDGDLLVHSILAATEEETEIEPDVWSITNDLHSFKDGFKRAIEDIVEKIKGVPVVCLSDSKNFRKDVYTEYKANRKNVRKPVGFKAAKAWVVKEYKAVIKPGLEADDVMGILSTKPGNKDAVIVSMDKDMKSIPGKLYRYRDDEKLVITEDEADHQWLVQTLTGDATDNYPGCPGIGPVKAEAILKKPGDPWSNVLSAFTAAGLTEQDAITQARLARILRWSDWNHAKQEPILWAPPAPDRPVLEGTAGRQNDGVQAPPE